MIILILLLIIIITLLTAFFIFVKKFNGLKEVTIILGSIFILIFALSYFLQDSDSEIISHKLAESNLYLNDNFKIIDAQDDQSLVDYYTNFNLIISENDKNQLIRIIKNAEKFKKMEERDLSDYWRDEYSKQLVGEQLVRSYSVKQNYYKHITFSGKSRPLQVKLDSAENKLQITDFAN